MVFEFVTVLDKEKTKKNSNYAFISKKGKRKKIKILDNHRDSDNCGELLLEEEWPEISSHGEPK